MIEAFIIIALMSGAITDMIYKHKEEMKYADQGLTSPRQRRKELEAERKAAAAGAKPVAPAAPGEPGFLGSLWQDAKAEAKIRRQRALQEIRDGKRPSRGFFKDLLDWKLTPVVDPLEKETPPPAGGPGTPASPATPARPDTDGIRRACPECGATLHPGLHGAWDHPFSKNCPKTGRPYDPKASSGRAAPPPPAAPAPAPAPPAPASTPPAGSGSAPTPPAAPPAEAPVEAPAAPDREPTAGRRPEPAAGSPETTPRLDDDGDDASVPGPLSVEELERLRTGLFGSGCRGCGAPRLFRDGQCEDCWHRAFDEQENRDNYKNQNPPCPKCRRYMTMWARPASSDRETWLCRDCWVTFDGPAPDSAKGPDAAAPAEPSPDDKPTFTLEQDPDGSTHWVNEDGTRTPVTPWPSETERTTTRTPSTGGTAMALEFNYDRIVSEHDAAAESLKEQLDRALAVSKHMTDGLALVEGLDTDRQKTIDNCTALVEGMTEAKFDARSVAGCTEAAESFNAGAVATVQEHMEETKKAADEQVAILEAALASVQASRAHIVAQYGDLAAGVQATGVRGEAMEAN